MRFTPAAESAATVNDLPLIPAMKLNGLPTASHTARTASRSGSPGAISTSAPAASYAFNRLIVSSRSDRPRRKFSVRPVSVNGNGNARAAAAAAAIRSVARPSSYIGASGLPLASSIEQPTNPASAASLIVSAGGPALMAERAETGEHHRNAGRVGGGNHLSVAARAAGLDRCSGTGPDRCFEPVGERIERVRGDDRPLGLEACFGGLCCSD